MPYLTNLVHQAGILCGASKLRLPSWVPDWRVPLSILATYELYISFHGAKKGFPPETASINVAGRTDSAKGIRLDTASDTTPAKQGLVDNRKGTSSLPAPRHPVPRPGRRTNGPPRKATWPASARLYTTDGSTHAAMILALLGPGEHQTGPRLWRSSLRVRCQVTPNCSIP